MSAIPEPWPNTTHLVVRGRIVVVTEHAPNGDSWRYHGTPADLAGDTVTFSHEEATPVSRPIPGPRRIGELPPDVARELMARARLSLEVFDNELARPHSPLTDLLESLAAEIRRGTVPANLREAYKVWAESGAPRA